MNAPHNLTSARKYPVQTKIDLENPWKSMKIHHFWIIGNQKTMAFHGLSWVFHICMLTPVVPIRMMISAAEALLQWPRHHQRGVSWSRLGLPRFLMVSFKKDIAIYAQKTLMHLFYLYIYIYLYILYHTIYIYYLYNIKQYNTIIYIYIYLFIFTHTYIIFIYPAIYRGKL